MSTSVIERPDIDLGTTDDTEEGKAAHIIKTEPGESAVAKVTEARVFGTPVEALCGKVWVPQRDPKNLPICSKCKEIYDWVRDNFNPNLSDRPNM